MADWEVARSQGTCAESGRALGEGEEFYAVLFDTPEGFVRRDYAIEAWPGPPEDAYCYWKSRIPRKEEKKRIIVDDTVLIDFFERLADEDEPARQQFRFVLALMLMRKRRLRYEATRNTDGVETWAMTLMPEGSTHEVVNPHLQDDEINVVSEQLTAILHGDFLADHGERLATAGPQPANEDDAGNQDSAESDTEQEGNGATT